jgi:hypothetical protein
LLTLFERAGLKGKIVQNDQPAYGDLLASGSDAASPNRALAGRVRKPRKRFRKRQPIDDGQEAVKSAPGVNRLNRSCADCKYQQQQQRYE